MTYVSLISLILRVPAVKQKEWTFLNPISWLQYLCCPHRHQKELSIWSVSLPVFGAYALQSIHSQLRKIFQQIVFKVAVTPCDGKTQDTSLQFGFLGMPLLWCNACVFYSVSNENLHLLKCKQSHTKFEYLSRRLQQQTACRYSALYLCNKQVVPDIHHDALSIYSDTTTCMKAVFQSLICSVSYQSYKAYNSVSSQKSHRDQPRVVWLCQQQPKYSLFRYQTLKAPNQVRPSRSQPAIMINFETRMTPEKTMIDSSEAFQYLIFY